jgi:glycine hydroxymethyltransferase
MASVNDYFARTLRDTDPDVFKALAGERSRQQNQIELIASENLVSRASLDALGSVMVNKTVEGYPGKRYYGGAEYADALESLAIERAKKLFGCAFANVQPHSGSQANLAVFVALLKPGDTILSMDLSAGGHLSHGAKANLSGKWFDVRHYGVDPETGRIDIASLEAQAEACKPKIIICGGSAYPRAIDFAQFRRVADGVGAWMLADMAHFAGLVAGGQHPHPFPHAHVATATTYKNLRGVRGGIVLWNDETLTPKFNSGVFPGVQGSVILNSVAAKAVCLGEALQPEFKVYAKRVLANARALAKSLVDAGIDVVTGGTDTPLLLVDLRSLDLTGDVASAALERAGLICNKNGIPGDPKPPQVTSGLRFGASAGTTRGFEEAEFAEVGKCIADVLKGLSGAGAGDNGAVEAEVRERTLKLCRRFPIYPDLVA